MLLWLSDSHFNFLEKNGVTKFSQNLIKENPDADALIITGDITSGEVFEEHLTQLAQEFTKPIYFVLGNHDFYNSSFKEIEDITASLTNKFGNLHWLNEVGHIYHGISIVGVGGWYDLRYGNTQTNVMLNDFRLIEDLWAGLNMRDLAIEMSRKRADKEAERLDMLLFKEICNYDTNIVLIATHVSPYLGSSWHEGHQSDRDWLPWFTSRAIGEVIDTYAENNPEKKFVVLSGHGHSPGIYNRYDNLVVYTGKAEYWNPALAGKIDVDNGKIECIDHMGKKVELPFP